MLPNRIAQARTILRPPQAIPEFQKNNLRHTKKYQSRMEKRAIEPIPIDLKTLNSMPRDDKITVIQEEKFLLLTKPPHYQADKKIKSN